MNVSKALSLLGMLGAWLLAVGLLWSTAGTDVAVRDPNLPPPPQADFSDFLVGQALVVEGTVLFVDDVQRTTVGGCGVTPRIEGRGWDVALRISQVRFGTAEDTVVVISTLTRWSYPRGVLHPGAHVLAWAYHNCRDGWRLWGGLAVVTPSGYLVGHDGSNELLWLRGVPKGEPIPYAVLNSAIDTKSYQNACESFSGKSGAGLVRVTNAARTNGGGYTFDCDSLGWMLGNGGPLPLVLDVPPQPSCFSDIQVGDSLVIPIPTSFTGGRLEINACPYSFQVKDGYVRGLGVPLKFLSYALKLDQHGIVVKSFVAKE
jgi:hypothetical protein